MLAWLMNLGFGLGGTPPQQSTPAQGGGGHRRRGSIWEPSVAAAIAAAQAERRALRESQKVVTPVRHPATRTSATKPATPLYDLLFLTLEAVQLAIKRADSEWLRQALRRVEAEEQAKLAALAREEVEAAQAIMLILAQGRREPIGDEEAAAILMNMLMNVRH
jgi:hypothetical protein